MTTLHKIFIGLCMWSPDIVFKTTVTEKDFFDPEHATIFKAMRDIVREGGMVDEGTLNQKTGIKLSRLFEYKDTEIVQMVANWKFYERQIRETTTGRYLREGIGKILRTPGLSSYDIVSEFHKLTSDIQSSGEFEISEMQKTVTATVDSIIERAKNPSFVTGVPSGLNRLDDMTQGFQPRKLYYIGARPSQGKTALLLNFIASCNVPCGVISAESGKEELMVRLLSKDARIDSQRIVTSIFKSGEMDVINNSAAKFYEKPIYIYDEPNPTIDTVVNKVREMKRMYDIQILYLDYLQCLSPSPSMMSLRYHEQIAYASKQMKTLARTLNIPIVATTQLNRDAEGNRPHLNNLSDSTQIERDADMITMIYNKFDEQNTPTETWLLIEKNRDGKTGDIPVYFDRKYMTFTDIV